MMFKSAVIASLVASAAAFVPDEGIQADSKIGHKLMSKARAVEQNGENTWLVGYSIKYLGCAGLTQVNGGQEGGNNQDDGSSLLYTANLVKFGLCKSDVSCSSCGSGSAQYVVPMGDFVDAWTESKMEAQEQVCENVRENCYCDDANDDEVCEAACYTALGMTECIQYGDEEEFEVQRFMECSAMEGGNDNNNNNNNGNNNNYANNYNNGVDMYATYYTGLSCASNGNDINLAIFTDSGCVKKATSGVYEAFNYGASLPYEKQSLIKSNECMACLVAQDDDGNNNYEVSEVCGNAYDGAAKCETNLEVGSAYFYPDTSGCDFIKNILPRLSKASKSSSSAVGGSGGSASTAFAVIFFLTSAVLGAYSFFLYRKIHRAKVNLAASEGMMMA